ncbi:stalk domain-containing protein [Paenibacillus sp. 1001270B_150601_E10]|uniref:stalk domain-containing protein n=1 Tax=Paenibacillus sp. 1001270B_150601_E10 TaxID=2787079 RepID=UPI00189CF416|nr:stalk domain-containing protein [Paenibacillus sp. 1001270B_150601_E10]
MKKSVATTLAIVLGLMGSQATFAAQAPAPTQVQAVNVLNKAAGSIDVNGKQVKGVFTLEGHHVMLPVRSVMEELGYKLKWNKESKSVEMIKENQTITVKAKEDRYTLNKMIRELGKAPVLKDNEMYVPSTFLTDLVGVNADVANGKLSITSQSNQETEKPQDGEQHYVITVNHKGLGTGDWLGVAAEEHIWVPIQPIAEALGYQTVDDEAADLVLRQGVRTVLVNEGEKTAGVNRMIVNMEAAPKMIGNALYVNLEDLGPLFNVKTGVDVTGVIGVVSEDNASLEKPETDTPQDGALHYVLVVNNDGIDPREANVYEAHDTVMVPAQMIGEALGYNVVEDEHYDLVLRQGARTITLQAGKQEAGVNRMLVNLKTAPEQKDHKLYVGMDALQELFGAKVTMDVTGVINIHVENK